MKQLNLFSAAALTLLFFKATQTPFFGAVPSWFVVILPILLGWVFDFVAALNGLYGWTDRVKYIFWERRLTKFMENKKAETLADIKKGKYSQFNDPNNTHS